MITREEIREYLNPIYDLERLISRISYKSANPRDLIAFKNSLSMIPHVRYLLKTFKSEDIVDIYNHMDELEDICRLIDSSINDDPPISIKDGGIIKEQWLSELESKEKEKTGIKNLKIK